MRTKSFYGFILVGFFSCQIFLDFFDSVTAFPFLHYGMFSGRFTDNNVQTFEVKVDNTPLTADNYGILKWDLIHSPLFTFQKQLATNDFAFDKNVFRQGMEYTKMQGPFRMIEPDLNNNPELFRMFPSWYKTYLEKLVNHKIKMLEVNILNYNYNKGAYVLVNRMEWIKL